MSELEKLANKINAQVKGFYLDNDVIVKAIRYLKRDGKVLFKRIDTGEEYFEDYRGSALFRKRVFIIGEVAKMVGRAVGTIRDYERSGLLPSASRFRYSNKDYRYYTYNDVREIESFFNSQKVGRPPKNRVHSRNDLSKKLRDAKKGIK
jgi:hypothetical protein|tara:strand:+ start:3725 stop:4171 length:447 start_codon:yes stop_codon:yes gene_type:complete